MKVCLNREEYEEIFGKQKYPKNTSGASRECMLRGADISQSGLKVLIKKGKIECPEKSNDGNRNNLWHKQDIDFVIDYCESNQNFTQQGHAAAYFGMTVADLARQPVPAGKEVW